MKRIIITLLFIGLTYISQSCTLNNILEQEKSTLFSDRKTISELKETNNCLEDNLKVTVSYVVDGDTFSFNCNNQSYKVRIIGIDTPETKHPTKGVQCFGKEASNYTKKLLNGKEIKLVKGSTTDNTDKYGRLLRYVDLEGNDFGLQILRDGYAFSYKRFPHEKLNEYNKQEIISRENNTGLWNPSSCDY